MKSIRYLAIGTCFSILLASAWSPGTRAQAPSANTHAAWTEASTGCGYSPFEPPPTPVHPQQKSSQAAGRFRYASLVLLSGHDRDLDSDRAPIVGLWKFKFVSKDTQGIPDGRVIDEGYATWHSDGTEIMNSGRPPITGSFCMGVWKKTGRSTYKLNHFALSWDPTGAHLIGPTNIKEEVILDNDEDGYSGSFTIDQYDTDGHILAHVSGTLSAQRITVD
jgi:hypothetical protein